MTKKDRSDSPHRRSLRLPGYDYGQAGAYFITVCAFERRMLFGQISNDLVILNESGKIVENEWLKSAEIRPNIQPGDFVVMPNHFHVIVFLIDSAVDILQGDFRKASVEKALDRTERFGRPVAGSVPTLVRAFKSASTRSINQTMQTPGRKIWQRNYHEHVIRDETDWRRIAEYVADNPRRWAEDSLNPDCRSSIRGAD
jgi:REP element-mobilizing transposase RayT